MLGSVEESGGGKDLGLGVEGVKRDGRAYRTLVTDTLYHWLKSVVGFSNPHLH